MNPSWCAACLAYSALVAACGQTTTDDPQEAGHGGAASTVSGTGDDGGAGRAETGTLPACLDYGVSEVVEYGPGVNGDAVVWTGRDYALVWSVNHESLSLPRNWFDIEVVRADRAGNVVAQQTAYSSRTSDDALVDSGWGVANVLSAVPADDDLAILYCEFGADTYEGQLRFLLLDPTGSVLAGPRTLAPCNGQHPGRMVWNGAGFGVVWEHDEALHFLELDASAATTSAIQRVAIEGMIATLHLFWHAGRYGLAWEDVHSALDANRFVTIERAPTSIDDSVLLSGPGAYANDLHVAPVPEGYTAVWYESDISGSTGRQLMASLDTAGELRQPPRELNPAPLVALSANPAEHGVLLAEETTVGTEAAMSLSFATLSRSGEWMRDALPLVPPERFARPVLFDWHESAFDLLFTQCLDDERRLALLRVICRD